MLKPHITVNITEENLPPGIGARVTASARSVTGKEVYASLLVDKLHLQLNRASVMQVSTESVRRRVMEFLEKQVSNEE